VVEQDVLEPSGEVDLCGANLWEAMEEIVGECRCTVLHRSRKTARASQFAKIPQYGEVEGNLSDATTWERYATVVRSGLYRNLAKAERSRASAEQRSIKLVEIGGELFSGRVLMPNFADLTTHADLNPGRL
jgi:hypothetical protein